MYVKVFVSLTFFVVSIKKLSLIFFSLDFRRSYVGKDKNEDNTSSSVDLSALTIHDEGILFDFSN